MPLGACLFYHVDDRETFKEVIRVKFMHSKLQVAVRFVALFGPSENEFDPTLKQKRKKAVSKHTVMSTWLEGFSKGNRAKTRLWYLDFWASTTTSDDLASNV